MTNSNRIRLTWVSFPSYALTGALATVAGMMMGNTAGYLSLPVSNTGSTFTSLNAGILISVFLNAWLMEVVPLKAQLCFGLLLTVLAVTGSMFSHILASFSAAVSILGVVNGITTSIGTFPVIQMYERRQRDSRLLFTGSLFSMAGTIFPIIAAFLLTRSIKWYWVYARIGLVYVAIFVLILGCELPALGKHTPKTDAPVEKEKQGIGVLLPSVTALCYILDQLGLISWMPEYAKDLGMSLNSAGTLVSSFRMSYMIGMWAFSFILRFSDLQRILTVLVDLAAILMHVFNTGIPAHMAWSVLALGFFSSVIYTTIITLGSQQTKVPSSKLVNFVLTYGTVGTILTFMVTGPIAEHNGPQAALLTVDSLCAVVFVMCFLLGFISRHRQHNTLISY